MNELRVGVIGLSPGNGHPYSWSAIINGYDPVAMEHCGFPVIPRYLEQQHWPEARIQGARVTHVWTQDPARSRSIAQASLIPEVAEELEDFIGSVDAVLLARDDAVRHVEHATPFLDAGLPIYIDKPIATSQAMLRQLRTRERYPGQMFTCSALRYAPEMQLSDELRRRVGRILRVDASTPKAWSTYAVHVVEPVTVMLGSERGVEVVGVERGAGGKTTVQLAWGGLTEVRFTATGDSPGVLSVEVEGERGAVQLGRPNTFRAFRTALQDFLDGVRAGDVRTNWPDVARIVEILDAGEQ